MAPRENIEHGNGRGHLERDMAAVGDQPSTPQRNSVPDTIAFPISSVRQATRLAHAGTSAARRRRPEAAGTRYYVAKHTSILFAVQMFPICSKVADSKTARRGEPAGVGCKRVKNYKML